MADTLAGARRTGTCAGARVAGRDPHRPVVSAFGAATAESAERRGTLETARRASQGADQNGRRRGPQECPLRGTTGRTREAALCSRLRCTNYPTPRPSGASPRTAPCTALFRAALVATTSSSPKVTSPRATVLMLQLWAQLWAQGRLPPWVGLGVTWAVLSAQPGGGADGGKRRPLGRRLIPARLIPAHGPEGVPARRDGALCRPQPRLPGRTWTPSRRACRERPRPCQSLVRSLPTFLVPVGIREMRKHRETHLTD